MSIPMPSHLRQLGHVFLMSSLCSGCRSIVKGSRLLPQSRSTSARPTLAIVGFYFYLLFVSFALVFPVGYVVIAVEHASSLSLASSECHNACLQFFVTMSCSRCVLFSLSHFMSMFAMVCAFAYCQHASVAVMASHIVQRSATF